jgi:ABC-type dipeptide/oligopeptide/nickel transport system permease subunit
MAQQRERVPDEDVLHGGSQYPLGGATAVTAAVVEELPRTRISSPGRDAWRRFRRNWAAMLSLGVIIALILIAAFAPFLHTENPLAQDYTALNQGPSWHHWFGTDGVGGDQYSRLLYGLRVPLAVGLVGTAITVLIGVLIGVLAGYFGGVIDAILSRFTDLMFAFPAFLLALISVSLFGGLLDNIFGWVGRVFILIVIFAAVSWPPLMRFVRSLTLSLKEQQFVEAARTCGSTNWKIIRRHLLPNMWGLILVQASFIVVFTISTETTLSIFSLGVPPPHPDLGQMLEDGVQIIDSTPWGVVFPSIFLTIIILAFTFLGDGVRDAVDPRMNS